MSERVMIGWIPFRENSERLDAAQPRQDDLNDNDRARRAGLVLSQRTRSPLVLAIMLMRRIVAGHGEALASPGARRRIKVYCLG